MNILITGGAGFIGSHLSERLIKNGQSVFCYDNLSTGDKNNIAHLLNQNRFSFMEGDVISLRPELTRKKFDQIYHLACPASPKHYQSDPLQTVKTSAFGTYNILELAKKNKTRILYASTSEVYGDPLEHPQKESYWGNVNPFGERSCYDEGKRVAETFMFIYQKKGLETRIARIFNTYGPKMSPNDGRVVSNFILQALKNEEITIYGEGEQTRSFCYINDLIDGLMKLMNNPTYQQPVNLGNPAEYSINELAAEVLTITKSSSKLRYEPLPKDDPKMRKPDITLAKKLLSWEPKTPLEEGIKKTADYFKTKLV